ncbi:MAG TPA: hypothetical protein VKC56_07450 [Gallionellaceae bacterium]|nr:hypothetical protein [Gallionellaceae bacterium]
MPHQLDLGDFRARRSVLDPADFALGSDAPEAAPTGLISEKVWREIMTLPDDVLIRTTGHDGRWIELLYRLRSNWLGCMPKQGILFEAMLDVLEDLDAALFSLMHGYYRQSITACRDALELMTFACMCDLYGEAHRWTDWQAGKENFSFRDNCVRIARHETMRSLETIAQHTYGSEVSLLPADYEADAAQNAWITNLHGRLCEYAHPRGTNGKLWSSNGPVYSTEGMAVCCDAYLECFSALMLLARIAGEGLKIPDDAGFLYDPQTIEQYMPAEFHALCTYYGNTLLYAK